MELIAAPMLKLVLLAAAVALCAVAGLVAAVSSGSRQASLALGVTVASAAALALLHFGEPLAAAGLLIAHGGLGVALARHADQDSVPSMGRTRWLLLVAVFAGILMLALASTGATETQSSPFADNDAFLLAVCALAALAVAIGTQALWPANKDGDQG